MDLQHRRKAFARNEVDIGDVGWSSEVAARVALVERRATAADPVAMPEAPHPSGLLPAEVERTAYCLNWQRLILICPLLNSQLKATGKIACVFEISPSAGIDMN